MNALKLAVFFVFCISCTTAKSEFFDKIVKENCSLTEYTKYIDCVNKIINDTTTSSLETNSTRNQLQVDELSCEKCECNECRSEDFGAFTENNCCRKCCQFRPCDKRHCCFKTCHSGCDSLECRYSCRHSCFKYLERQENYNIIGQNILTNRVKDNDALNITTRINLTNIIENTNKINTPFNLNSSNQNQIFVSNSNSHHQSSSSIDLKNSTQNCCKVSQPERCSGSSIFPFIQCDFNNKNSNNSCGTSCSTGDLQKFTTCNSMYCSNNGISTVFIPFNGPNISISRNLNHNSYPKSTSKISSISPHQQIIPNAIPVNFRTLPIPQKIMNTPILYPQFPPNLISFPQNGIYFPPLSNALPPQPMVAYPQQMNAFYYMKYPQFSLVNTPYIQPYNPYYVPPPNNLFQTMQPQINYQLTNPRIYKPAIFYPAMYSTFSTPQVVDEILPNPSIAFNVQLPPRSGSNAEIMIEKESEWNKNV